MANPMLEMIHGLLYGKGLRFGKLSGTGRVIAQMMGKRADRVPFMGAQMHDHAMTVARVPARKFYWDAELMVDVHFAVGRWYGFDSDAIVGDTYNLEVEALGGKMIYSDNAMPTVDTSHPLIKGPGDLDKLGPLDPSKGRISVGTEIGRLVTEKVGGPFAGGFFCSPFSFICQAMGYPKAIRALRRDKGFAQELFDYAENEAIFPYLKAQAEAGVKQSMGADAWACFPNLAPETVEEWVLPSAVRLGERGKKELKMRVVAGLAAADYCEEDLAKFDRDIMWRCFDLAGEIGGFGGMKAAFMGMGRTQDWDPQWVQDYALDRGGPGGKAPILAGLNARFTRDSSPQEVAAKMCQWIDVMGREGKLVVMITNIPADTPPINVHTAVHATKVLGRYPIAEDLRSIKVEPPQFLPFDEWLKGQPEADIILKARE